MRSYKILFKPGSRIDLRIEIDSLLSHVDSRSALPVLDAVVSYADMNNSLSNRVWNSPNILVRVLMFTETSITEPRYTLQDRIYHGKKWRGYM